MGCVYSYPLFSFQGSNRFVSDEIYFIKSLFRCQVLFQKLFNFYFIFSTRLFSRNHFTRFHFICQCFSFKTSHFHFSVFTCRCPCDLYYYTPFPIFVNIFFKLFSIFFNFPQKAWFSAILPIPLSLFFPLPLYQIRFFLSKTTKPRQKISRGKLLFSIITLSFLLRYLPVFFLPCGKRTVYKPHHL